MFCPDFCSDTVHRGAERFQVQGLGVHQLHVQALRGPYAARAWPLTAVQEMKDNYVLTVLPLFSDSHSTPLNTTFGVVWTRHNFRRCVELIDMQELGNAPNVEIKLSMFYPSCYSERQNTAKSL